MMKIKEGYLVREVAGSTLAIPVGEEAGSFGGMLRLNETGVFLWHLLEKDTDAAALVDALLAEYEGVDRETAARDVEAFLEGLRKNGILSE
jgi:hypothetical protein